MPRRLFWAGSTESSKDEATVVNTPVRQDPCSLVPRFWDEINRIFGDVKPQGQQFGDRSIGRFFRHFVLSEMVDSEKVNATGTNGGLMTTKRKQAKALPRRMAIAA